MNPQSEIKVSNFVAAHQGKDVRRLDPFADQELLQKIYTKIDPFVTYMETSRIFKSKDAGFPSILVFNGAIWVLDNPAQAIADLGLQETTN